VKETVLSLYREAASIGNDNERKTLLDFAKSSESNHRMNAVIALARSERGIPIRADDLDGDVWLLILLR
jgi:putative DNA primase/helicase